MELSDKQLVEALKARMQTAFGGAIKYMNVLFFTLFIILLVGFVLVQTGVKIVVPDETTSKNYVAKKDLVTKADRAVLLLVREGHLILKCKKGRKYRQVSPAHITRVESGRFQIRSKSYKCYLVTNTVF